MFLNSGPVLEKPIFDYKLTNTVIKVKPDVSILYYRRKSEGRLHCHTEGLQEDLWEIFLYR